MPKSLDKTKGARKRKKSPTNSNGNTESDGSGTKPGAKKKKVQKRCTALEGIEMSKQLASEVKNKRNVRTHPSKMNSEPRLLGNGKPMPSLAVLEAMYADSDDDEDTPKQINTTTSDRCSTPTPKPIITEDIDLNSPETLMKITSKVIDIIEKNVNALDNVDGPPPPVIPQKKPKKSGIPHIVGCKERPQIPWAPKTKFCVGSEEYGIDKNVADEEEEPKKRKKRGEPINFSKSIFNAKSDEIADRLKELDSIEPRINGSPDSNVTIDYDFQGNSPRSNVLRSFSPLPSTSRDSETILKNDKLFTESLHTETISEVNIPIENDSQDDIEIIDVPCETIEIDDTLPNINIKTEKRSYVDLDDDCCILVEPEIKKGKHSKISTLDGSPPKDDVYASIDLTQTYCDNEVYEINDDDIDNLIAENKAILEKNVKKNSIDTVTAVDPNVIIVGSESETTELSEKVLPSMSNANNSEVNCHPPANIECVEVDATVPTTDNNIVPTLTPQDTSGEIAEVVTNFFNNSQSTNNSRQSDTVDLSAVVGTQETLIGRISSWIYSIESFLSGRQSLRQSLNASNDVVVINDNNQAVSCPNSHVTGATANLPCTTFPSSRNCQRRRGDPSCHCRNRTSRRVNNNQRSNHRRGIFATGTSCSIPPNIYAVHNSQFSAGVPSTSTLPPQSDNNQPQTCVLPHEQQTSVSDTSLSSPPSRSLGDCPICMDSLANSSVASTMCGHVFCMPCIKAAIRSNGKKCPTCRKALKGVGYHQLFI